MKKMKIPIITGTLISHSFSFDPISQLKIDETDKE
jgi:hypothetical protein